MRHLARLVAISTIVLPSLAGAQTTIDFQDIPSGYCEYYGQSMVSHGYHFGANDAIFSCEGHVIGNNTTAAIVDANSNSIITMTQVAAGTFSLNSFYAGVRKECESCYHYPTSIDVLGNLFGGGTVFANFALDQGPTFDFDQFLLSSNFTNLTSVVFSAVGDGHNNEFVMDDIVVNGEFTSTAPEPGTALLALTGFGGLFMIRRRRRAA
jgi:MYXO-CTERM domain-containing protein